MKLILTAALICISFITKSQDVAFMLAGTSSKKWIGMDKAPSLSGPVSINLVFHTNHTVDIQPVNSHKNPATKKWLLLTGSSIQDENITIEMDKTVYSVVFSKTANGSEFMTLSYTKNDRHISRSYYSE